MAAILRRALLCPLVFLNFFLYMILLGIAGAKLNDSFERGFVPGGNGITVTLVIFALIAGVVGVASSLAGMHHLAAWRTDSFAAAGAAGLIAWLLTLLSFGIACKHIRRGRIYSKSVRVLESIAIILAGTQLFYLLMLHTGIFSRRLGGYKEPGYVATRSAPTVELPPTSSEATQKPTVASAV
ncbi:hypothetical protein SELMODRAFT_423735 [Selaginella moellendorffii]|uniref:AWPM-19-like family protein n=1 Tax=Selaginella moellendorffii TaxID=88036 RepID=D8SMP9_SELML|nr:membrane protein PM19L [Selaginella moellendorffii]EFJ14314.1 hypothetical protein SELMODRAFT_423735 [Selaginella moellendorffii]|eukprot:XP_002984669.1 membrane protein PM19L [Selaginella moellendorffii]